MKKKKFYILTIGCAMNKSDSERLSAKMIDLGFQEINDRKLADFVFINTCGVRQSAEDRVYMLVPVIKKENKNAKIVITGCLSERKDVIKRLINKVDVWLPIKELPKLEQKLGLKPSLACNDYLKMPANYESDFSVFLPIGNGCNNFCSYCVVPYARGREKYRSGSDIIKEVRSLILQGFKEINLIAQNVNSYKSGKFDFADLLERINNLEGDFWIRFSTSHPKDMSEKLIKTIASGEKICKHIHLPVQAGDNGILKAMNRKYTVAHYERLIKKIRKYIPDVSISTDTIVGFPGETKEQFNNTKKLYQKIKFDLAYIAQYSPRPGTVAFSLDDNVSKQEKKRREDELMKILSKSGLENNKKYINKTVKVLIEGKRKIDGYLGKTDTYKVVKFNAKNKKLKIGEFVNAKIIKANNFGLEGELVKKPKVLVILGPTSSGKTGLAVRLAHKHNGEVISADSRQVYKYMDIGTGKDLGEYEFEVRSKRREVKKIKIKHHLIDVVHPNTEYNLAKYVKDARKAIDDVLGRGKLPILCGGTGLYIQAIVDGYDISAVKPDKALREKLEKLDVSKLYIKLKKISKKFEEKLNESEKKNKRRLIRYIEIFKDNRKKIVDDRINDNFEFEIIGLDPGREIIEEKIYKRIMGRLDYEDMIGEVRCLHGKHKVSWKRLIDFGLEYKFITYYLQGKLSYDEMIEKLHIATRQFAKRQMTWFRRWQKQGREIVWFRDGQEALKYYQKKNG